VGETRPLIGITTYVVPARFSYWDTEAALVPAHYVRAVERAGARPLLVPPSDDGSSTGRSRIPRRGGSSRTATAQSSRS